MATSDALDSRGDYGRRLHDLERKLQRFMAARRGEHMTVGTGGLDFVQEGAARVYNLDNELVMRIGALGDGEYGIEAIDEDGTSVQLSTLAFRERSDYVETGAGYRHRNTLASWGNLTDSFGPVVEDVTIGTTGKARVILSALINATTLTEISCAGFMGVEVSGDTSVAPTEGRSVGLINLCGVNTAIALTASKSFILEGLNPGVHTFTAKYKVQTQTGVGFNAREIVVQPF